MPALGSSTIAAVARVAFQSEGVDGGAGRNAPGEDASPTMTDLLLVATGRKASGYTATNGIFVERGREE
jgi:hypothetical protein